MRLKKLGAALFVVAALGAVLASSALAAAVTEDVKWWTQNGEEAAKELTGSETVSAEQVGTGTFSTTVSTQAVELEATTTECVGCKIETSGGAAVGSGQLKFGGVKVLKPENCTTTSSITTKALTVQAGWMSSAKTEPNYVKFVPTAGEEAGFASFELTGEKCPLKTTIVPKGSVFVLTVSATADFTIVQQVKSSAAINSAAGGTLHVGSESAVLTATANFKLSGAKSGQKFATK